MCQSSYFLNGLICLDALVGEYYKVYTCIYSVNLAACNWNCKKEQFSFMHFSELQQIFQQNLYGKQCSQQFFLENCHSFSFRLLHSSIRRYHERSNEVFKHVHQVGIEPSHMVQHGLCTLISNYCDPIPNRNNLYDHQKTILSSIVFPPPVLFRSCSLFTANKLHIAK